MKGETAPRDRLAISSVVFYNGLNKVGDVLPAGRKITARSRRTQGEHGYLNEVT